MLYYFAMPKLTFDEIMLAIAVGLRDMWLKESQVTVEDLRRLYDEAIPIEYVKAIEEINPRLTVDVWPRVLPRLHRAKKSAIVRDDMQPEEYRSDQVIGRPITSTHPFARALKKAKANVSQWAKKHGETRSKVKSWILDGEGGRPIPRKYAEEIERDFGIPATTRTWKNGIKD